MSAQRFIFVCVQTLFLTHVLVSGIASANLKKCEVLTIPMCKNLGYSTTFMPNRFDHKTQQDAALEIDKFSPFVEAGCSPMLQFFVCSLYAPACDKDNVNGKELLPCRSVCENAMAGCLILMKDYGIELPWNMESCDLWPKKSDDKTCLSGLKTRPAISRSSFTLSGKTRPWLTLKEKILTMVTLRNSDVSFLTLEKVTMTLMLLKNTSVSFFDLTNAKVNLLTLASTSSVSHFTVLNTSLNSLKLMNTTVSFLTMTKNSLNSLTLMNTSVSFLDITNTSLNSLKLMDTTVSFLDITNTSLNSLKLMNTTVSFLDITNTSLNSLTLMNTKITFLDITNTNIMSFTLINSGISSLTLINTTMTSLTRINSQLRIN